MTADRERFLVVLSSAGRTVMRGWWGEEAVARGKFRTWIGSHGTLAQPRVTLSDESEGTLLTSWPDEP